MFYLHASVADSSIAWIWPMQLLTLQSAVLGLLHAQSYLQLGLLVFWSVRLPHHFRLQRTSWHQYKAQYPDVGLTSTCMKLGGIAFCLWIRCDLFFSIADSFPLCGG